VLGKDIGENMINEKINRIYVDGKDEVRTLQKGESLAPPTADFCEVCGHWALRLTVVAEKKCCKPCGERVAQMTK
jgi:hypothetical protein